MPNKQKQAAMRRSPHVHSTLCTKQLRLLIQTWPISHIQKTGTIIMCLSANFWKSACTMQEPHIVRHHDELFASAVVQVHDDLQLSFPAGFMQAGCTKLRSQVLHTQQLIHLPINFLKWKGLTLSVIMSSFSPPRSHRYLTTSSCPFLHAECRQVVPTCATANILT